MAAHGLCQSSFLLNTLSFPFAASSSASSPVVGYGSCCSASTRCYVGSSNSTMPFSSPWNGMGLHRPRFSLHVIAQAAEVAQAPPSASDGLTMNLKVEGTISDSLIPKVTDALKNIQGVSNLKVYTFEGVATVELAKQTTIQATGEASSLLEAIQGEGFKLQNLSICFDDPAADADEDIAYEYENSS